MFVPKKRPEYSKAKAEQILKDKGLKLDKAYLIGIRGYYKKSMGNPLTNDRGIMDDAIILISPDYYKTFNANTDGGVYRKGMANLATGIWSYRIGIHGLSKPMNQRYKALVQAKPVTVNRDQSITESGWFGINIHKSSLRSVSSLGCQTIFSPQWKEFIYDVEAEMKQYKQRQIEYILIEF